MQVRALANVSLAINPGDAVYLLVQLLGLEKLETRASVFDTVGSEVARRALVGGLCVSLTGLLGLGSLKVDRSAKASAKAFATVADLGGQVGGNTVRCHRP